ncbi:MAG: hypothetical protein KBF93_05755 [Leptospiraceae bacterium]|nr:hypothetical protein [Leptospiraceae bacterium]
MKHLFLILFTIPFSLPLLSVSSLEQDPAFVEIKAKLNANWKVYTKKDLLFLERKEPVFVMPEKKVISKETLYETDKEKLARMKKFGMKMKPNIIYRFQKRWTVNDLIQADMAREEIQKKISALPKKYKIEHLLENDLNRQGSEIYVPKTKQEKSRVKEYFNEKSKLEKKIPPFPNYHLTKFSLFLISKKGISGEYSEVYPESVTGEFIQVDKLLFKYKVKQ